MVEENRIVTPKENCLDIKGLIETFERIDLPNVSAKMTFLMIMLRK